MTNATIQVETSAHEAVALVVRPIGPADAERIARMFSRLSRETVLYRFLSPVVRLRPATIEWLTTVDHVRREALVALDGDEIVAVARYDALRSADPWGPRSAEIAVTVEDAWQRRGIGRRLVRQLAALAVERGYDSFVATILAENRRALSLTRTLVPHARIKFDGGYYDAVMPLAQPGEAGSPMPALVTRRAWCP